MMRVQKNWQYAIFSAVTLFAIVVFPAIVARAEEGNFSLQVTPSPLVLSIKPGETMTTDLKIRNNGDKTENLKIEPKSFTLSGDNGQVTLGDTTPADIGNWIKFSDPTFRILPGEWFTQKITISLPETAGFSYSFALVISRANNQQTVNPGESALHGSVAVFTLVAVDRPDAKKELAVTKFYANQRIYEYLPAEFTVSLKNTGNTIALPSGTVFIQRSAGDIKPIATLPVNEGNGYILPGTSRSFMVTWHDGFPAYKTVADAVANQAPKTHLTWDWSEISQFRFGRYTAKLVAIYNDGNRDIPLEAETTFWVIPWKLLLIMLVPLVLIGVGIYVIIKKSVLFIKPKKKSDVADADKTAE